jgi:hypothetical protein
MKRRHKKFQIALSISILFSILLFPAYLRYCDFVEADFLPSKPSFENFDQENLSSDHQNNSQVFGLNSFDFRILGTNLLEKLPYFSFQTPVLDQKPSILRC